MKQNVLPQGTDTEKKFRHEYKYLCTGGQMAVLEHRIASVLQLDPHIGRKGYYTISSLYFDDYSDRNYWENEDGTDPREKFRIRIYDYSLERIQLELKRKERGMTQKSSCLLTKEEYHALMAKELDIAPGRAALLNRLLLQQAARMMEPKVVVEYQRVPYVCETGNVRITFDRNMSSSDSIELFGSPQMPRRSIMPRGWQLLEVKFDELLPDYIYRVLQLEGLSRTTYSKYYLSRKYTV